MLTNDELAYHTHRWRLDACSYGVCECGDERQFARNEEEAALRGTRKLKVGKRRARTKGRRYRVMPDGRRLWLDGSA